jgi:hypothetical protein
MYPKFNTWKKGLLTIYCHHICPEQRSLLLLLLPQASLKYSRIRIYNWMEYFSMKNGTLATRNNKSLLFCYKLSSKAYLHEVNSGEYVSGVMHGTITHHALLRKKESSCMSAISICQRPQTAKFQFKYGKFRRFALRMCTTGESKGPPLVSNIWYSES